MASLNSRESLYSTVGTYESDDEDEDDDALYENLPKHQEQIEQIPWFHPNLTRHHSEGILKDVNEGIYLLRKRRAGWGCYSLDVKYKHSVKHFPVTLTEKGVELGSHQVFPNVDTFKTHLQTKPLFGDESGSFIQCLHPYPRSVEECDVYDVVTCHFLFGQGIGSDDESSDQQDVPTVGLSAATKEGYIRKQGGRWKSWKTRWFVLKDNNVCYYRNHKSKKPIRRLQINEIVYIFGDDSTKSFRIVLPWRTFYLEAPTIHNKKEWVELLRWKLEEHQKKAKDDKTL